MADKKPQKSRWEEITSIWHDNMALIFMTGLIGGVVVGLIFGFNAREPLEGWFINGFWAEALGITLTVGLLDTFSRLRERDNQKQRLTWQANSKNNGTAIDAIDELRSEGWLCGEDGLLQGKYMRHARLMDARLKGANLQDTDFFKASFIHAQMTDTNLANCDLRGAKFCHARLLDADFTDANIDGANFTAATLYDEKKYKEGKDYRPVILPSGKPYNPALGDAQWDEFNVILDEDIEL